MKGIINFYKPKGMTSHDAVNFFRRLLGIKRIGHTGTLDPNAEGVLPICVGKATRVSEYLLTADKEYVGELTLGHSTDTQDGDGELIEKSTKLVTDLEIRDSFEKYKGEIEQIPPMFSALKHKGKKLYELAREGKTVERKARDVSIYELNIMNIENNKKITFYVKCSRGTYIRTLCHDIGNDLGTLGYMSDLKRVGAGPYKEENSYRREELEKLDKTEIEKLFLPIDSALMQFEKIVIADEFYNRLTNGVKIEVKKDKFSLKDIFRIYSKDKFIGIGEIIEKDSVQLLKMNKVFV